MQRQVFNIELFSPKDTCLILSCLRAETRIKHRTVSLQWNEVAILHLLSASVYYLLIRLYHLKIFSHQSFRKSHLLCLSINLLTLLVSQSSSQILHSLTGLPSKTQAISIIPPENGIASQDSDRVKCQMNVLLEPGSWKRMKPREIPVENYFNARDIACCLS